VRPPVIELVKQFEHEKPKIMCCIAWFNQKRLQVNPSMLFCKMVPWYVYLEALFCLSGFSYLETALFCGCVYAAKKPTRQWAAWTHQEEECFFTALRQVGKNFLKITSHVQSKNKDQVGHYYCRLDTNAAMLRWWSLLEKHSCKASKLHLKPRRFKLFLEALEHQLLKDSRKSTSKRACHGETFSSASLENISSQSRERGLDNRPLKMILCDSQNVKKLGPGRSSTKQGTSSTSFYAVLLRLILWTGKSPRSLHSEAPKDIDSDGLDPPATEDTHDAFSFQKNRLAGSSKLANVASPGGGEPSHLVEATSGDEGPCNFPDQQRDPMEEGPTTINSPGKKTLCGFADPDSLGPTDLDIRSSKYPEDLNLNKSLDGLRRLIATSLDAFQNCSVFGFDSKKDTSNMV
ncbi:hypothetical protein HID58_016142, partial [Brassica napus]